MQSKTDQPKFMVTGAAGWTGRRATQLLLDRGHAVRAFVRVDDDRARVLADAGAEVVVGDMFRLDDVSRALEGVHSAYFVYPIAPGLLEATAVFAQAATETGVRAVVNMSQISARREATSNAAQQHWIGERLLDRAPFGVTHLRPTFFADNFIYSSGPIAQEGVFRYPFGEGRHAPIAVEDQAHVIAAVMANPEPHAGKTYPLHGPVEMNHHEIAESFSKVLGRTITYEPIDRDRFAQFLTGAGYSEHLVQHLTSVSIDYQNGVFSGTNDVVPSVGKTTPTTIEDFIVAHRAVFMP
ncbi:NmrA family NAD(P)-binding protein [Nocardia sp. CA-084685]|uniref:NmrA family NAD(P)-binding protein n=1 Tax=Nocardia sp. CA-084685 TaxID=3239970 RepID=UPI003D995B8D